MSYPMPGYTSAAMDPRKPTPASRTLRSQDRGEIAAALLEHLQDPGTVTELLDCAGLEGDGQVERARVSYDKKSETWTADMFGKAEAA